jgi:hypothetical protein
MFTGNKIEAVTKFPNKEMPRTRCIHCKFYQNFNEELIPTLFKLFHEIEREGILPNSFYEASITQIPKPDKSVFSEHRCKYSQLNTGKPNSTHIKKIVHHNQVVFIQEMQGWFNIYKSLSAMQHINRRKEKNPMII